MPACGKRTMPQMQAAALSIHLMSHKLQHVRVCMCMSTFCQALLEGCCQTLLPSPPAPHLPPGFPTLFPLLSVLK